MPTWIMTKLPGIKPMVHISRQAPSSTTTHLMKPSAFKAQLDSFQEFRQTTGGAVQVNPREDEPSV